MNDAQALITLGVGAAASLSFAVAAVRSLVARRKESAREARWAAWIGRCGLAPTRRWAATGTIRGARVEVTYGGDHPEADRFLEVAVELSPPLDLGLHLRRRTGLPAPFACGGEQLLFDDGGFDAAFVTAAIEPSRGHALFNRALRTSLRQIAPGTDVHIDDRCVTLRARGDHLDDATLTAAADLAALVMERRWAVPPPRHDPAYLDAWWSAARQLGLAPSSTPLGMFGRLRDLDVSAATSLVEGDLGVDLAVTFARRLSRDVRIVPNTKQPRAGTFRERFLVLQNTGGAYDVLTGDEVFATDVTAAMVRLDDAGPFTLDRAKVTLRLRGKREPRAVADLLVELHAIADRISCHGANAASPFRSAYR